MTTGQRLVARWLRQRKLKVKSKLPNGRQTIIFYKQPTDADYAELARRIDSFAKRMKIGAV